QGRQWRFQEYALLLVLRQEPARGAQAHRRSDSIHLRRVRRIVHGHHQRGEQVLVGEVAAMAFRPPRRYAKFLTTMSSARITPRRCSRSRSIITTTLS